MDLVYKNEKRLFMPMLVVSVILWALLVLGTVGIALLYALAFYISYLFAQSAMISHIRGTAVHITDAQFPDLKQRIDACCAKLDMDEAPEAYLMQMGGTLNAFATRFFGRDFMVLYSDVVDALEDNPDALNFYIGHELGHIKRRHIKWSTVLLPASILPLVGAAYHRAREYTCDRHGLAVCADPASAQFGLAALAAGGKRWRTLSKTNYIAQSAHSGGFWMSFHELVGDYPWLVKRMGAVKALGAGQEPEHPSRHGAAYLLALITPRFGVGGGGGIIVMAAIIGMLAAVGIPAYQDYTVKAKVMAAYGEGQQATQGVEKWFYEHQAIPATLAEAGVPEQSRSPFVDSINVNSTNGVVTVLTTLTTAHGKGVLVFNPTLNEQRRIAWHCRAEDIDARLLPASCR